MKNYDPNLKNFIPSNTDSDFLFNKKFIKYHDLINERLAKTNGDNRYLSTNDQSLLYEVLGHLYDFNQEITADNILMLVHPFYTQLSNMNRLTNELQQVQARLYLKKLNQLLENRDPQKIGIVVMDSLHHYASTSSRLLEKGLIDQVVLTECDSGVPLDPDDLNYYKNKNIFLCGGYNTRCLSTALYHVHKVKEPDTQNLWVLSDLSLNSPQDHNQLTPNKIMIRNNITNEQWYVNDNTVITLDEMLKMTKLTTLLTVQ